MTRLNLLALVLALFATAPAFAETFHVDDSATTVEGGVVRMKWDELAPRSGATSQVTGRMTVHARLDVSPWAGRSARIYITLPADAAVPVLAQWTTRGRLLPGALRSGERALVYAGPVSASLLEDTLQFTLTADGRRLARDEQPAFAFEIDPESP